MSSGAQLEAEWSALGIAPHEAGGAQAPGARTYLSDEEILGIDAPNGVTSSAGGAASPERVIPRSGATRNLSEGYAFPNENPQRDSSPTNQARNDDVLSQQIASDGGQAGMPVLQMPEWMRAMAADPRHAAEAQQLWQEHQAFRAAYATPEEARAMKELFPGGASEAQALRQGAQAIDQIDAAIYSGDARAQAEVVSELARANPAAFRSLFAEAAKVLAGLGNNGNVVIPSAARNLSGGFGLAAENAQRDSSVAEPQARLTAAQSLPRNDNAFTSATRPTGNGLSEAAPNDNATTAAASFDAAAYAAFERATNDAVARDVRAAVSGTLARVLPEGVAEGAARRIGEDIFQEIHRTLAADPTLSEQVGEVLRARQFGAAEQMRVAQMLSGRAQQLLPSVARRVIGEWTGSVLGTARTRSARQAAAASRVDIAAPGGSMDSMPLRPLTPREVDYARMSDDDILSM